MNKLQKLSAALISASVAIPLTFTANAEIIVQDYELTKKERLSRTDFRYEFDVSVLNTGTDSENISVSVSSTSPALDVSQSSLFLDELNAGSEGLLEGKLVIIQDRRTRFDPDSLVWEVSFDEANGLNPFEQTYAPDSAYITGIHTNYLVEEGIASESEVSAKIEANYAQFFELIEGSDAVPEEGIVAFEDTFTELSPQWIAFADNGTSPEVSLSLQDERLAVNPTWNATGDAIAVKFQQFEPADFTNGAEISYLMEAAEAYAADANLAVQLILEDENFTPAFFAYRFINQPGEQAITVSNVGPQGEFGFVGAGFDFTKVAGIGFQFLANNKPVEVGGSIFIDDVKITVSTPPPPAEIAFEDNMDAGIANWFVQNDNGTSTPVALSNVDNTLVVSPQWLTDNDAFSLKYQQFEGIDISGNNAQVSFDMRLPSAYVENGNLAIQLVIEDINFQVGFTGYASVAGQPGDETFTLSYNNIGPDTGYGFVSSEFDWNNLAGIGIQILAAGKPVDVIGDIIIEGVRISVAGEAANIPATSNTSVLFAAGEDMAFIKASETQLIYSEGMSYGMMMSVMMEDKETFDKLWKFTKTYMQNKDGPQKDFFAWRLDSQAPYTILDENPAPDGEEYFAMALFFADNLWGSGEGIFDYNREANAIIDDMIFKTTETTRPMMHPEFRQVEFNTSTFVESFTDASYHLPAFYELWALWADNNNQYWHEVAQVSREFFAKSAHPVTGLFSEYATHEGEPKVTDFNPVSHKSAFDSHRVMGNIAMDYHWFSKSEDLAEIVDRKVNFIESEFETFGNYIAIYELDGTREPGINYRGEGNNAMNGYGSTVSALPFSDEMLRSLWEQQLPTGQFRYYDGFLYMFALMHASGDFKIHRPAED